MASLARVLPPVLLVASLAGCGGGDDGPQVLDVEVGDTEAGLVDVEGTACERVDDQLVASGVVRNGGDVARYVSLQVRFVDADGVRVELASDSVSDLQRGESSRWEATVYADEAGDVVRCEVTADVS